ncbi:transposase [Candidatus Poribacteria bacterium]|nr:transposase [Candidatus Poribacteria bacterium]
MFYLYCHRKFRPLPNIRLCYNDNLTERSIPMAKRRKFTPKFKAEVVLEALRGETSQAELCRRYNLSENQVSTWKRQLLENAATLFESNRKQSDASTERIVQLEQLAGRLTQAVDIQKKALDWVALNRSEE